MSSRRASRLGRVDSTSRGVVVGVPVTLVAVGVLIALLASRLTWITASPCGIVRQPDVILRAKDVAGADVPLALAAAAAFLAAALVRSLWGRRLLAVAAFAAGVGLLWLGLQVGLDAAALARDQLHCTLAGGGAGAGPILVVVAAVLIAAGSLAAFVAARRWPTASRRYEAADRRPRDDWEALERGEDPTRER